MLTIIIVSYMCMVTTASVATCTEASKNSRSIRSIYLCTENYSYVATPISGTGHLSLADTGVAL